MQIDFKRLKSFTGAHRGSGGLTPSHVSMHVLLRTRPDPEIFAFLKGIATAWRVKHKLLAWIRENTNPTFPHSFLA